MFLQAKIKCEKDGTPYRVYINSELITERVFTVPMGTFAPIENIPSPFDITDVKNVLNLELTDADDYTVSVENVPGHTKAKIWIDEVKWQEKPYEDK